MINKEGKMLIARIFATKFRSILCLLLLFSAVVDAQWINIGPGGGSDLQSIAVNPVNPDIVYVGGDIEGIFKSTDGGSSWTNINSNLAGNSWTADVYWTNDIEFDLSDDTYSTLFLCTAVALFKTTNAGLSWQKVFPSQITSEDDLVSVYSLGQNPNNTNELFAGTEGKGLFKSSDYGSTWQKLNVPISDEAIIYCTSVAENGNVFLGSTEGVYCSTDGGSSWTAKNNGLPHTTIWNFKINELNGQRTLFATLPTMGIEGDVNSFKGGLYKSTDDGDNWVDISGNLPKMQSDGLFYYYWKFTVSPDNPDLMYIGTSVSYPEEGYDAYEDWGVYKTVDGGITWLRSDINLTPGWMAAPFFDERHALVLAMARSNNDVVYWGRDWMNKTTDGGINWTQIYTTQVDDAWKSTGFELMIAEDIAFSPSNEDKIFVGYDDMGPFRSDDAANSFKPLDATMDPYDGYDAAKNIYIDPSNGDVYMSRYDGMGSAMNYGFSLGRIYKSTDDGVSMTDISNGFPDGQPFLTVDFTSGSAGNRVLYATSFGNGVFKSTNSGSSWTEIDNGLGDDALAAWIVLLNPNNTDELYLGINQLGDGGAIYKTTDGGSNWNKLVDFPSFDVLCLQYDAVKDIIYAGATENYDWSMVGGIFKSADGGDNWIQISDLARVVDIAINPSNPDILYAAAQSWYAVWQPDYHPGIYRSNDGGDTWVNITENLANSFVTFARLNPNNNNQLFVGTAGCGLWVTDDATSINQVTINASNVNVLRNYPNPFYDITSINYSLSYQSHVTLKVYDLNGNDIATLVNEVQTAGSHGAMFNGSDLSSGVYYYNLIVDGVSHSGKMQLIK